MYGINQSEPIQSLLLHHITEPKKLEFENEQTFLSWLKGQKNQIPWRKHDKYTGIKKHKNNAKFGRPVKVEWSQVYRCPFSGKRQSYTLRPNSRRATKESINVGCKATIKVKKHFDDDKITVTYDNHHLNHYLNSNKSW